MEKGKNATNIFIKECIAQALVELIQTKPLSKITITELADRAGVSRMSYYRNFQSKEEIFSSYLDVILARYDEEEKRVSSNGIYYDKNHMVHYFTFLLDYKEFFSAVTQHGYGDIFLKAITGYIVNKWQKNQDDKYMEYYTLHAFAGSLFNLYVAWAENDYKESPEKMAKILYSIHCYPCGGCAEEGE